MLLAMSFVTSTCLFSSSKSCDTTIMPARSFHRHNIPSARELRGHETAAELRRWAALRDRRLGGLKFLRQHPIGPFVADFCCVDKHLIIEIDGPVHDLQRDQDRDREALLTAAGYLVVRFANDEVLESLPEVLRQFRKIALERTSIPSSERSRGW
jgi:very-short-patch-repair endonuclease